MQQSIRRVDPISVMKVFAVLYAVIGLCAGAVVSLISLLGFMAAAQESSGAGRMLFGTAAVILLPIFYGILGAIGGLIMAALYNVVAKATGGVQIELG